MGGSLKWVKASERLPEKDGSYYLRVIKDGRKLIGWFSKGTKGNHSILKSYPYMVEWLDDTNNTELKFQVILNHLRKQLETSKKITQSTDDLRWRDGMESGLETAIELLEAAITKENNFS